VGSTPSIGTISFSLVTLSILMGSYRRVGSKTKTQQRDWRARDLNTAKSLYLSQVRNAYNSRLIRSEKTSDSKILIESGSYLGAFLGTGTFQSMFVRYEFEFQVRDWSGKLDKRDSAPY
jgi:hypothetical protein